MSKPFLTHFSKKLLSFHHVQSRSPQLTQNWDVNCYLTEKLYKIKERKKAHKTNRNLSIKPGVTPLLRRNCTCVFLTSLSVHAGRGYVLHPKIDMKCHPKTKNMIQERPAVGLQSVYLANRYTHLQRGFAGLSLRIRKDMRKEEVKGKT